MAFRHLWKEVLKATNEQIDSLVSELKTVSGYQHSEADYDRLEKDLHAHVEVPWKAIMSRQIGPTRHILCKLLNGNPLPFPPISDCKSRYKF